MLFSLSSARISAVFAPFCNINTHQRYLCTGSCLIAPYATVISLLNCDSGQADHQPLTGECHSSVPLVLKQGWPGTQLICCCSPLFVVRSILFLPELFGLITRFYSVNYSLQILCHSTSKPFVTLARWGKHVMTRLLWSQSLWPRKLC